MTQLRPSGPNATSPTAPRKGLLSRPAVWTASAALLAFVACAPEGARQAEAAPPGAAQAAKTQTQAPRIADFELKDHTGKVHRLHALKDAKAVVLVMQGVGCPIVRKLTPTLKQLEAEYAAKGVKFLMVNSNIQDTPEVIAAEAEKFGLKTPVLKDQDQSIGRRLNAVRTAETFVIDPKTWTVLYHGPIDDRLTYGRERAAAESHYVKDVLNGLLAGRKPAFAKLEADGCLINYVTPEKA